MVSNTNINFNINYIKKNILNSIKNIVFNWNGIIFGGVVHANGLCLLGKCDQLVAVEIS